ncbi:pre-mRNA-splicing factor prp46 [Thraustotheca clavata]|uniref:Pre-mRNA-splicing factor prp46 n=1 Tax=Thraustotheca clavata TaxID=74557 RepID=A0A1V9ZXS4_9STRA|nr:pre-mRNA-splicing factor prp46 [Thraustotheca clavata]
MATACVDMETWSVKKSKELFSAEPLAFEGDESSQQTHIQVKFRARYANVPEIQPSQLKKPKLSVTNVPTPAIATSTEVNEAKEEEIDKDIDAEAVEKAVNAISKQPTAATNTTNSALVEYKKEATFNANFSTSSTALVRRRHAQEVPKPQWHAPWKLKRVIAGHLGWVRSIAVDPTNEWFATGSADRSIKVWDLASGQLKLTLTGHINCIRGLAVSDRHPYLFSCAEDKKVLCWDLEYNKVIRSYHGHLSGVFCLKLHPTLDILVTGGRDAVARVWDMRTKQQIHVLSGHQGTVWSLETQPTDPQILSGAADGTVKLWDLAAGKTMTTLTNHKKAVRAMACSPNDHTFLTGAADNLKKWQTKDGKFLRNFSGHNAIVNSLSINQDNVAVSCADNGTMRFWDYTTGYCFQKEATIVQPGSLDSEAGIYASSFDKTGLRLITAEADKTIKVWQEDSSASPESHPIDMTAWTKEYTAPKRF